MKIALLQLAPEADTETARHSGLEACREARRSGADIALLPEAWSHGYAFFDPDLPGAKEAWRSSALSESSDFVQSYRDAARDLGLAIGLTFFEATALDPRNAFILIDRRGEIVLRYAKVHTCLHGVERFCSPGRDFSVATLDTASGPVTVGAMICYDREFPESARVLALKGAEIVLVPNACMFDDHRVAQMKTRAFENKIALAMTNYSSAHPDANGRSLGIDGMAFSPSGGSQSAYRETLLLEAGPGNGVYTFEVDVEDLRDYRRNAIWGAVHRRPDTYETLVDEGVDRSFHPENIIN